MRKLVFIFSLFTISCFAQREVITFDWVSNSEVYVPIEAFGPIGADCNQNRITIQTAIDNAAGRRLLATGNYCINLDSNGRGLNIKSNTYILGRDSATFTFYPADNFKTSNFAGGTVAADQIRAITIDNSSAPVNNFTLNNLTINTPLIQWYETGTNYLKVVPICFYFNNTNVESDFDNATPAYNYNLINCNIENFQRGSVTVRGRKIENILIDNCNVVNMGSYKTKYPTESRYIYTPLDSDSLSTATTSYNFAIANGVAYTIGIYYGDSLAYSIPYTTAAADASIGDITNNPLTAGLMQWTIDPGILASATKLIAYAIQRTTDATAAPNINGVGLDISNCENITINDCYFTGGCDQFTHYIYMTRETNDILIQNNTFEGLGIGVPNSGGGLHIRGSAYRDVQILNNTFTNVKGQNMNLSSVTNLTASNNTHVWNYDNNLLGSLLDFTIGAASNLTYSNNVTNNLNHFTPPTCAIPYLPLATSDIDFLNNTFSNINVIAPMGTDILFDGNTVTGSAYTTAPQLIVMSHTDVTDTFNIVFSNNAFTFGIPSTAQPTVTGFTGFTWDSNTISPSINSFIWGDALKLHDLTINNCTINSQRFNVAGTLTVDSVSTVQSYQSDLIYTDMVQNQDVIFSNITDLGTQPRPVSSNILNIIKTGNINFTASGAVDLDYLFFRSFNNVNLPYQVTLTNTSAFTVTLIDYTNSVQPLKNIDNGGVNLPIGPGGSFTVQLDKINARWVVQ